VLRVLDGMTGFGDIGIYNSTSEDKLTVRFDPIDPVTANVTMVTFWDKSDFRNGADNGAGSELSLPNLFSVFPGGYRWLVRNGPQYYVSQSSLGNNTLAAQLDLDEIAAEMWAAYNPVQGTYDMDFDAATAAFDTPSSALTDITAVGLIWDLNTYDGSRRWTSWGTFRAVALVDTPINRGPLVEAGTGGQIEPGEAIGLSGSASDEGLPEVPGTVAVQWSVQSGPAAGVFSAPLSPATSFTPSTAGTYVLRLTAADGSIRTFDDVAVTASGSDPFTTWIDGYPAIPVQRRGLEDDWIGDGILHVVKFAFNLDPTASHSWQEVLQYANSGGRLELSLDLADQRNGVLYRVEFADDFDGPWTVLAEAADGTPMAPAASRA